MAEVERPAVEPAQLTGWPLRVAAMAKAMIERIQQLEEARAACPDSVAPREQLRAVREMSRELAYTLCDLTFVPDQALAEDLLRRMAAAVPDEPRGFLAQMATPVRRNNSGRRVVPAWSSLEPPDAAESQEAIDDDDVLDLLSDGPLTLRELLDALGYGPQYSGGLANKLDKLMGKGEVDVLRIGGRKVYGRVLRGSDGRRL